MINVFLPFMLIPLNAAFRSIDPNLYRPRSVSARGPPPPS